MDTLLLPFSPRFIALTICGVATVLLLGIVVADRAMFDYALFPCLVFGTLTLVGLRDLTQQRHAVLRTRRRLM